MDPTSLIPAKYAGIVLLVLALKSFLDAVIRLVPDQYWKAHTTEEAIRNGYVRISAWLGSNIKPPAASLLFFGLLCALPACKASPEVIALTSARVTASSIADGIKIYHDAAPALIQKAHDHALIACPDPATRVACVDQVFKPLTTADSAILAYAALAGAGGSAASADWTAAVNGVIDALGKLGITIKGAK